MNIAQLNSLKSITTVTTLNELTSAQLKELQTHLARLGFYPSGEVDGIMGEKTRKGWKAFKDSRFLDQPSKLSPASIATLLDANPVCLVDLKIFNLCFKGARGEDRENYFLPINQSLREFEINTKLRIAHFFAQVAHESGNLRYSEELSTGALYEGRRDIGNIFPGDGKRYKGRGLIQLTGRDNYIQAGKVLGINLEENPQLAQLPYISARIAGLYWQSRGLNQLADRDLVKPITKKINGGYIGLDDREKKLAWMKKALRI